jgi:hypothetical protein
MKPDHIEKSVEHNVTDKAPPPLEKWHPALTGDMDLIVTRDGQWLYEGHPIGRESAVRLFSTILRKEDDGEYYLITPVEKWRIQVEDTPLLAHSLAVRGEGQDQVLSVTTNMGETLDIGDEHPLVVDHYPGSDEPRPLVFVRHGAEARLLSSAFYELAELVEEREVDGECWHGVFSQGNFWKISKSG